MKKLMKWFKGLPKEAKMMICMVGLGSPIAIIYLLRRSFFPRTPVIVIILYVALAVGVIFLLVYLISRIFGRGRRKRTERLAADLAAEGGGGPQSMDIAAAIKSNNDKFFAKIREMRKDVGINVYELPWYVVIGDSGCGKTKLINEGGLTFSTGKPEGYQLGTLNYNWWFAEEAIFIDMAGRLCNPQDDNDRREWVSMLDTIAKGRKGFPINGAVVCISADHLLQDPPEKIERDANTALERMRDLQTRLGVTFATYLVVTKCDKILGFMQFFDRAERDITVKNQIFGWSKPGEFNELHDPDAFQEEFGTVYNRLHELRVRRLNDDAEEVDLGLAYGFPEEFRAMYDPLQIYVQTLFPMIKNPRALKNLIFRGIYFTSATQEGGLILKHVAERLGQQATEQFAALDELYPNKRPHFIKDVLVQKMVPEHGLVFRNEDQVLRNRRLNKVLKVGTITVGVVLGAMLVWGSMAMQAVTGDPRDHALSAKQLFVSDEGQSRVPDPSDAVGLAVVLESDAANLRDSSFARWVVSTGIGADEPIELLDRIRAKLAEVVVTEAMRRVDDSLRSGEMLKHPGTVPEQKAYLAAMKEYASWYACRGTSSPTARVSLDGFKTMLETVKGFALLSEPDAMQQVEWYFGYIQGSDVNWPSPATMLAAADAGFAPADTLQVALGHVYTYFDRLAHLDGEHPNGVLRSWLSIRDHCAATDGSYGELLDGADEADRIASLDGLTEFQGRFTKLFTTFDASLTGCTSWTTPSSGTFLSNIPKLSRAIGQQRQEWVDFQTGLGEALGVCGARDPALATAVKELQIDGSASQRPGLDRVFWNDLQTLGILDPAVEYRDGAFDDPAFADRIREIYETYQRFVVLTPGDSDKQQDALSPTADAAKARSLLRKDYDRLAAADFTVDDDLSGETLDGWATGLLDHLKRFDDMLDGRDVAESENAESAEGAAPFVDPDFWQPAVLTRLDEVTSLQVRLGEGTKLLRTITRRLDDIDVDSEDSWGIAEMVANCADAGGRSPYNYPMPEPRSSRSARRRTEEKPADTPSPRSRRPGRRERRGQRGEQKPQDRRPAAPPSRNTRNRGAPGQLPKCAAQQFLNEVAVNVADVLDYIGEMNTSRAYLPDNSADSALHDECLSAVERTTRAYMRQYLSGWATAYDEKELKSLDDLSRRASDWQSLGSRLHPRTSLTNQVGDEFVSALSGILEAVPWASYDPDPEYGGYWDALAGDSDGFRSLSLWMRDSIDEVWKSRWDRQSLRRFMDNASRAAGEGSRGMPWDSVSERYRTAWVALAKGIAAHRQLDNRGRDQAELVFGKLAQLQSDHGLNDERLTGELVAFEQRAEDMFSAEITQRLVELQTRHLGGAEPDQGWPYLPGKRYESSALRTVDFSDFKNFLVGVIELRTQYQSMEKGLRRDALGREARNRFYDVCQGWHVFLGLGDARAGATKPITVAIERLNAREGDPPANMDRPDDGCQIYAHWCELNLGLRGKTSGADKVNTACAVEDVPKGDQEASWSWEKRDSGRDLEVRLIGPRPGVRPIGPQTVGQYSELALVAYLHRYGHRVSESSFKVLHNFKVEYAPPGGVLVKKTIGQQVRFTLDRELPTPIGRLAEVSVDADDRR